MSYTVTSPLVIVPNADGESGDGYFYEGATIPSGYNDKRCKELVDEGLLEQGGSAASTSDDDVPAKSASKAEWVAYATDEARGGDRLSEEEANSLTKDDLAARILGKA